MNYLEDIIKKMEQAGVTLTGCSEEEIKEINGLANKELPKCYIEFLESMGNETSADESRENWYFNYPGFQGSTVFYPSIKYLNETWTDQLIEDGSTLELPVDAFVFYDHQGYLCAFFNLNEGNNPPVYGYQEGYEGEEFPKIADSLQSFYERHLKGDKTLFKELES